jgi:cysteine synthase A
MQQQTKIFNDSVDFIGHTPLYKPERWLEAVGLKNLDLYLKLESFNLTGSVKDRAALGMILDLEAKGKLQKGGTLIEPTSGNTGISLAALGAIRGYKTILVMPETMSVERRNFLKAYGAEVVLTPGDKGMAGAIEKAQALEKEIPGAVIPDQFSNPANPAYHEKTTGPEIWEQTGGKVDVFLAGVGSGGTFTGVGRYLKAQNPDIKLYALEPETSAVLSGQPSGKHGIQGIGAGFVPGNMDKDLADGVLTVSDKAALDNARLLARTEGLFVGISSGAALAGVLKYVDEVGVKDGQQLVTLLPDSGDRYLSTDLVQG